MLNTIDIIAIVVLLFGLWDGWRMGIMRSILTPFCLIFCSIIGIINFDLNENIARALFIAIGGGFILSLIIRLILIFLRSKIDKNFRNYVFWVSRLLGAAASTVWKGTLFGIGILLITLLPSGYIAGIENLQKNILISQTFDYTQNRVLPRFPIAHNIYMTLSVFKDPARIKILSHYPEFSKFFESQKVKSILEDEGLRFFLESRHYELVITYPKVRELMNDDDLMAKLGQLSRKLYEERIKAGETP